MRRIGCCALLVVVLLAASAPPAAAKGAASARLDGPGIDEPIDLLADDSNLPAITGAWFTAAASDVRSLAPEPPTRDLGPRYTLTWVMLGPPDLPSEERSVVQYVYPHAAGGPLTATPPGQDVWQGSVGWYRAPAELRELLGSVGVLDAADAAAPLLPESGSVLWPTILLVLAGALMMTTGAWRLSAYLRQIRRLATATRDPGPTAGEGRTSDLAGRLPPKA